MPYLGRPLISDKTTKTKKIDNIASSFNSAQTVFSLTSSGASVYPASSRNLFVSINGVLQEPDVAYTINAATITFTSAPTTGATFFCVVNGEPNDLLLTPAVSSMTVGANVSVNATTVFVGNSTANVSHTATSFAVANSTNTATLTATSLTIGGTIANTTALVVPATSKFYLDGGGDTYIYESAANVINIYAGGAQVFNCGYYGAGVISGKSLWVDGGGDTLIYEPSANIMALSAGAVEYRMSVYGLYPANDNARECGISGSRWYAVWAANGTIQTSDRTKKHDIVPATLGLDFVQRLQPVEFTMNDEADDVRRHGLIAQDVIEAAQGVSLAGILVGDREGEYGLNYAGFIPALIAAIQQQQQDIDALKSRLVALEQ